MREANNDTIESVLESIAKIADEVGPLANQLDQHTRVNTKHDHGHFDGRARHGVKINVMDPAVHATMIGLRNALSDFQRTVRAHMGKLAPEHEKNH